MNSDAMTDLERAQNLHSPKKILHFDPPGCVLKELWDQSRCIQSNVKPRAHSDISDIFRYTVYYIYILYIISLSNTLATLPMTTWPNRLVCVGSGKLQFHMAVTLHDFVH